MPSHPTRRGLLALLSLMFLFAALAQPALAKNTYAINDGYEGDPGDGVLNPAKQPSTMVMPQYDTGGDVAGGGRVFVVTLPFGPSGLSAWFVLSADPWHRPLVDRPAADSLPSGGRWHHAR